MCTLCQSKGLGLDGKPCQETGGKIGKATPTSMDRASPSKSPQVMAEPSLSTMLRLQIGSLAKPLRAHSFR